MMQSGDNELFLKPLAETQKKCEQYIPQVAQQKQKDTAERC
jgi:hypothetical protein